MDIMNMAIKLFYNSENDKEIAAFKFLDLLLPHYPQLIDFRHSDIVTQFILKENIKKEIEIIEVQDLIEYLLKDEGFAVISPAGNLMIKITKKGRKLKRKKSLEKYYKHEDNPHWRDRNWILADIIKIFSAGILGALIALALKGKCIP